MSDYPDLEQHREEMRAGALIDPAFMAPGLDVYISPVLPLASTPAQDARRLVRHGFASARRASGEAMYFPDTLGDVGPLPGDDTHAFVSDDKLWVSRDGFDRLRGHRTSNDSGIRPGL